MGLSCNCDFEPGPGDWYWYLPDDYTTFPPMRRRRCCSCKGLIDWGAICIKFKRRKIPYTDVECNIFGEDGEIPLADWWMCEECADLFWSLTELGFCFDITEPMRDLAYEYAQDYGPAPPINR